MDARCIGISLYKCACIRLVQTPRNSRRPNMHCQLPEGSTINYADICKNTPILLNQHWNIPHSSPCISPVGSTMSAPSPTSTTNQYHQPTNRHIVCHFPSLSSLIIFLILSSQLHTVSPLLITLVPSLVLLPRRSSPLWSSHPTTNQHCHQHGQN